MSVLMNSMPVSETQTKNQNGKQTHHNGSSDEMTLVMSTTNHQKNAMPEALKKKKQSQAETSLEELLHKVVEDKGELESMKLSRSSKGEFTIEGVSQMTLHSFFLKAEELGKNISYTRSLKVEITD